MAIHFNHTILSAHDSKASAIFLAEMLNLPAPRRWGPFQMVVTENGANLDYMDTVGEITPQHYAFLISEAEFDEIFGRIRDRKLSYWADPGRRRLGEINHHDGGRGVYFEDPNAHLLEIITRPYGSGGWNPSDSAGRRQLPSDRSVPRLGHKAPRRRLLVSHQTTPR